jgi:hypothetical protein
LIYRRIAFGLRKSFGMHRKVIGSSEGVSEAPGGLLGLMGHTNGNTSAHMAWCAPLWHPSLLYGRRRGATPPAFSPREKKEGVGRLLPFPSPHAYRRKGWCAPLGIPRAAPTPIGAPLEAASPPPIPIYMWGGVPHITQLIPRRVSAPLRL